MIKILVVDTNVVYARRVCNVLQSHGKDIEVDIAHNIYILRDRLKKNGYDLVLADLLSVTKPADYMELLGHLKIPVIAWSFAPSLETLRKRLLAGYAALSCSVMEKPVDPAEVSERLLSQCVVVSGA